MTDIEIAKKGLAGHTICLSRDGKVITSDKHGIAPMMDFIAEGKDIRGYSVADLIVGKAVAMLFVKCKIAAVYAKTMSQNGKEFLEKHGIPCQYETLTEKIINREGNDLCPMEKTVTDCYDVDEGYLMLKTKLAEMRAQK